MEKDSAGVGSVLAVNSPMIERTLPAIVGFLTLCAPLFAQEANGLAQTYDETITLAQLRGTGAVDTASALALYRSDIFSAGPDSILIHGLPTLTLLDGRRLADSSAIAQMGRTRLDLFPIAFLKAVEVQKVSASPIYGADAPGGVINLQLNRDYSGGEAGVFYGRSGGKFGQEDKEAYILGGAGNEKTHISVGVNYQELSGRFPP
jgi:outer membrane receptor protein involved in Fe transport